MPLYEYECPHCGRAFEQYDVRRTVACPYCAGTARKVISLPAVHFRGVGFTLATPDVDKERVRMKAEGSLVEPDELTAKVAKHGPQAAAKKRN